MSAEAAVFVLAALAGADAHRAGSDSSGVVALPVLVAVPAFPTEPSSCVHMFTMGTCGDRGGASVVVCGIKGVT